MKDKKVIFMGTPLFAVEVLEKLIEYTTVVAVVTQRNKEVGRKKILTPSAVKKIALENNIKVLTPDRIRDSIDEINSIDCDIIVTCAYGQIIPEEILYHPKYKTINVHASLLPKYRGGAPIQRAIMDGCDVTGVTIMFTDKGMDTGNIISKKEINININDDIISLNDKLSMLGAELLIETLPSIFDGTCCSIKQDDSLSSIARIITRDDEELNFDDDAINVYNRIRALSNIGAYVKLDDFNMKIFKAEIGDKSSLEPGCITMDKSIRISTRTNDIVVQELQIPGKKRMLARDYLNGKKTK